MKADRDALVTRLTADLVGPVREDEVLEDEYPSDVYLTGILWPHNQFMGEEEAERLDAAGATGGPEDESQGAAEEIPIVGHQRPCSAGLTLAVSSEALPSIAVTIDFGIYEYTESTKTQVEAKETRTPARWRRRGLHLELADVPLTPGKAGSIPLSTPDAREGLRLHTRAVPAGNCTLITVTLINDRTPAERSRASIEQATLFQVRVEVRAGAGTRLVAKPRTGRPRDDEEERSADLLYKECRTFAVGHICSAEWDAEDGASEANSVATAWLPRFEVPRISAKGHKCFEPLQSQPDIQPLEARWLATASRDQLLRALQLLVACYSDWLQLQERDAEDLSSDLRKTAEENLKTCRAVRDRMQRGAKALIDDENLFESFRLANLAMQRQHGWNPERKDQGPFRWWPFQLAFIILAGPSACVGSNEDRPVMDLLWFPTGGGKTEAYLGIIAMTAFYRRLSRSEPDMGAGVAAIMRYTLRLLTTQQFVRAATMVLSCESLRRGVGLEQRAAERLGTTPFSIGLWLGGDATPNGFEEAAEALTGRADSSSSPRQLLHCPCCHSSVRWQPHFDTERIEARCPNQECMLGGTDSLLPVWTVDSDIYREAPTLLIGTVDKFAQLPRRAEIQSLFAFGSDRAPDLIIQDELHLISGPLGTIAALYEMALDWLWERNGVRPKVIGSTATIRRATPQVRALFDRKTEQFPPAALDHLDTGFAVRDSENSGRLYVAITTAGRSAKFTLQAVAGCLLQSAYGVLADLERRDPYSTLVAYFNSLRELGGALVLMQDDVHDSIRLYAKRHGEQSRDAANIDELTSRRTQDEVRDMLDKLAVPASRDDSIDAVLATSMLSVGVDIRRLGLMLVNGQPKMRSEYIQVTSRVGRDKAPGLVVTVLNNAKPRDRSHYETFPSWHQSLYRDVEVTSVTPFASRARDRALKAVLAAMVRNGVHGMHASPRDLDVSDRDVIAVADEITRRAAMIDNSELNVRAEVDEYLDDWESRRPGRYWNDFRPNESLLQSAERVATLEAVQRNAGSAWPALNNMRSVEPNVRFRLAEGLKAGGRAGRGDSDGE